MNEVILHIDMDNFFVSVERSLNPKLENVPLMIGGPSEGRGVIVAASYDVKALGVKQGMPVAHAVRFAPNVMILPPRHKIYTQISAGLLKILSRFTDVVEPASVDEAYLDVSGVCCGFSAAADLGLSIKEAIRKEFGLPASIGIAPTGVVAKIASGVAKPDGIQVVPPENVPHFLGVLPVEKLGGIGAKTAEALEKIGVRTLGDLASTDELVLTRIFGKNGKTLLRAARGESKRRVIPFHSTPDAKSMSNETTLARDTSDMATLEPVLLWLSEKLSWRMRRENTTGRTFEMKLRFSDFTTITRRRTLDKATNDEVTIYKLARESLRKHGEGLPLRLIGIGMSGLGKPAAQEMELFLDRAREKRIASTEVFDEVRRRFGRDKLKKARLLR